MLFYFGGWTRLGGERDFDGSVAMFAAFSHSFFRRLAGLDRAGSPPGQSEMCAGKPPTMASEMVPDNRFADGPDVPDNMVDGEWLCGLRPRVGEEP
jgi:hypothetical protein